MFFKFESLESCLQFTFMLLNWVGLHPFDRKTRFTFTSALPSAFWLGFFVAQRFPTMDREGQFLPQIIGRPALFKIMLVSTLIVVVTSLIFMCFSTFGRHKFYVGFFRALRVRNNDIQQFTRRVEISWKCSAVYFLLNIFLTIVQIVCSCVTYVLFIAETVQVFFTSFVPVQLDNSRFYQF